MTSDQIFNPSFWYLLLGLMATLMPLYIFILWRSKKMASVYLGVLVLFSVYMAFFSMRNFGGAFGAGMALACLSAFLVPLSLVIWLLLRRFFFRNFAEDIVRRRLYIFGGLLIVLLQVVPFVGSQIIDRTCSSATRRNAEPLIAAVSAYYQAFGAYPANLDTLFPIYISEMPGLACDWLSGNEYRSQAGFEIVDCGDGNILLANYSADGTSIERYYFTTGNWSSVSFLDGACSFLR